MKSQAEVLKEVLKVIKDEFPDNADEMTKHIVSLSVAANHD